MPRSDAPPLTRGVVLRGFGLAFAVALSAAAAWLIVTGKTPKRVELGVLAGLWAALIGAFAMFGARRFVHPLEAADEHVPGSGLELRSASFELERAEEAAARRAHEVRLEQMLRREIQAAMTREVAALRAEIADLRSELLEKVGGQLRLERIETTRVIGSDLEALQHEVRQLKAVAQEPADMTNAFGRLRPGDTAAVRPIVEPARVRPVSRHTAEVESDVQPARAAFEPPQTYEPPQAPEPPQTSEPPRTYEPLPRYEPPTHSRSPVPAETTGPIGAEKPAPTPAASPPAQAPVTATPAPAQSPPPRPQPTAPAPQPTSAADEFASLPRLRPFTDFELDPVESSYTGRRRRTEDVESGEAGRHARNGEEAPRRHRRAEDSEDDLLARLLARESSP
jgi:hypothetical protein